MCQDNDAISDYIHQRDEAMSIILAMTDELVELETSYRALESRNHQLEAQRIANSAANIDEPSAIERKVFEFGCEHLLSDCFYTWNKVVQSSDSDEKAPCPFEQWRKSALRNMYQPDWISVEQLYDVLDPYLRKLYAEHVKEFMMEEDDE